jgi:citrate lyase subunit beta / citryl-CoA lyase
MRRLRSVLFVPGTRADRFERALASGADAVVFDLEDSVEPGRKDDAREAIGGLFARSTGGAAGALRFLRVNAVSTAWWSDDTRFAHGLTGVDAVVLPKAESAEQVAATAAAVAPAGAVPIVPLLETSRGVLGAAAIAAAKATIPALLFGAEDLTAELGVPRTIDGEEVLFARSQVVLAAASAGTDAIDAVFTDIADEGGLRRDASRARALGFHGKMAIHPGQIATIHDVFTPTAAEFEQAQRIVDAYDAALRAGSGVIRLDGKMVDVPVATRARKLLAMSQSANMKK